MRIYTVGLEIPNELDADAVNSHLYQFIRRYALISERLQILDLVGSHSVDLKLYQVVHPGASVAIPRSWLTKSVVTPWKLHRVKGEIIDFIVPGGAGLEEVLDAMKPGNAGARVVSTQSPELNRRKTQPLGSVLPRGRIYCRANRDSRDLGHRR
jgi:hypothetical protein